MAPTATLAPVVDGPRGVPGLPRPAVLPAPAQGRRPRQRHGDEADVDDHEADGDRHVADVELLASMQPPFDEDEDDDDDDDDDISEMSDASRPSSSRSAPSQPASAATSDAASRAAVAVVHGPPDAAQLLALPPGDLRHVLRHTAEQLGIRDTLQAHLRATLLTSLKLPDAAAGRQSTSTAPSGSRSVTRAVSLADLAAAATAAARTHGRHADRHAERLMIARVADSLVMHHLVARGYEYALSVYLPEAGMRRAQTQTPAEIAALLGQPPPPPPPPGAASDEASAEDDVAETARRRLTQMSPLEVHLATLKSRLAPPPATRDTATETDLLPLPSRWGAAAGAIDAATMQDLETTLQRQYDQQLQWFRESELATQALRAARDQAAALAQQHHQHATAVEQLQQAHGAAEAALRARVAEAERARAVAESAREALQRRYDSDRAAWRADVEALTTQLHAFMPAASAASAPVGGHPRETAAGRAGGLVGGPLSDVDAVLASASEAAAAPAAPDGVPGAWQSLFAWVKRERATLAQERAVLASDREHAAALRQTVADQAARLQAQERELADVRLRADLLTREKADLAVRLAQPTAALEFEVASLKRALLASERLAKERETKSERLLQQVLAASQSQRETPPPAPTDGAAPAAAAAPATVKPLSARASKTKHPQQTQQTHPSRDDEASILVDRLTRRELAKAKKLAAHWQRECADLVTRLDREMDRYDRLAAAYAVVQANLRLLQTGPAAAPSPRRSKRGLASPARARPAAADAAGRRAPPSRYAVPSLASAPSAAARKAHAFHPDDGAAAWPRRSAPFSDGRSDPVAWPRPAMPPLPAAAAAATSPHTRHRHAALAAEADGMPWPTPDPELAFRMASAQLGLVLRPGHADGADLISVPPLPPSPPPPQSSAPDGAPTSPNAWSLSCEDAAGDPLSEPHAWIPMPATAVMTTTRASVTEPALATAMTAIRSVAVVAESRRSRPTALAASPPARSAASPGGASQPSDHGSPSPLSVPVSLPTTASASVAVSSAPSHAHTPEREHAREPYRPRGLSRSPSPDGSTRASALDDITSRAASFTPSPSMPSPSLAHRASDDAVPADAAARPRTASIVRSRTASPAAPDAWPPSENAAQGPRTRSPPPARSPPPVRVSPAQALSASTSDTPAAAAPPAAPEPPSPSPPASPNPLHAYMALAKARRAHEAAAAAAAAAARDGLPDEAHAHRRSDADDDGVGPAAPAVQANTRAPVSPTDDDDAASLSDGEIVRPPAHPGARVDRHDAATAAAAVPFGRPADSDSEVVSGATRSTAPTEESEAV